MITIHKIQLNKPKIIPFSIYWMYFLKIQIDRTQKAITIKIGRKAEFIDKLTVVMV